MANPAARTANDWKSPAKMRCWEVGEHNEGKAAWGTHRSNRDRFNLGSANVEDEKGDPINAVEDDEKEEEEPGLTAAKVERQFGSRRRSQKDALRREEVDEASARVVEEELQRLLRARLLRNDL